MYKIDGGGRHIFDAGNDLAPGKRNIVHISITKTHICLPLMVELYQSGPSGDKRVAFAVCCGQSGGVISGSESISRNTFG